MQPLSQVGMLRPNSVAERPAALPHGRALPDSTNGALVYASDNKYGVVLVYSYRSGKKIGELRGFPAKPAGLCSDTSGNIYVTTQGNGQSSDESFVYEFAHGGTTPIATLTDPGFANGCAFDNASGNLAVTNLASGSGMGNVAIFEGAQGTPDTYTDPRFEGFLFCSYDNVGDLFADGGPGNVIDMLPKGGSQLAEIALSQTINPGSLQWIGKKLVAASVQAGVHGNQLLYQIQVSGSRGHVQGAIILSTSKGTRAVGPVQFWIQNKTIVGPSHKPGINGFLEFWKYPEGGLPIRSIRPKLNHAFLGVTVSKLN